MRAIYIIVLCLFIPFGFLLFFRTSPIITILDAGLHQRFYASKDSGYGLTKEECQAKGGDFRKPGPSPVEICQIPSGDGGKACISGFQCEWGSCVGRLNLRQKVNIIGTGQCTKYKQIYGCVNFLSFGLVTRSMCLD